MATDATTERIPITFETVQPETVEIVIDFGDGREHFTTMQAVSYAEWERLEKEIPQPIPPISGVDANKRLIYNYQDPEYIAAYADYQAEVVFNRLLGHITFAVPGATRADQRTALRGMDKGFTGKLIDAMTQLALGGRARVETRSRNFHGT